MTAVHPGGGASHPPGWNDGTAGTTLPEAPDEAGPVGEDAPEGLTVTTTEAGPTTPGIGTPEDSAPASDPPSRKRAVDPASLDVLTAAAAPKGLEKRGSKLPAPPRPTGRERHRREAKSAKARVGPRDNIPIKVKQRSLLPHIVAARINNLTLRARLGAFVSLVVGIAVAIVSLSAFFLVRVQYYNAFDKNLFDRAQTLLGTSEGGDPTNIVLFPAKVLTAADIRVGFVYDDGFTFPTRTSST